ncbi:MAG: hypothetical protein ABIQ16_17240 [Polyangiaceae bacterium]
MNYLRIAGPLSLVGVLLAPLGCGSSDASVVHQSRTITVVGDTCGEWQLEPAGSMHETIVDANCGPGLTCAGPLTIVYPAKKWRTSVGRCVPEGASSCAPLTTRCPGQLVCASGFGIQGTGQCFVDCKKSSDCPGPMQTCLDSTCTFLKCPLVTDAGPPPASCTGETACVDGLCTLVVQ